MIVLWVASCATLKNGHTEVACPSLEGASQIPADAEIVVVGEMHGTREMRGPAAFQRRPTSCECGGKRRVLAIITTRRLAAQRLLELGFQQPNPRPPEPMAPFV
jgi:hypothetical protein